MKLLIITNLFPNKQEPNRAVFNKQQFEALSKLCELKVVAPLPFFQCSKEQVPDVEVIDGIEVYHPRYLVIPKILRCTYGFFYYFGIKEVLKRIRKKFDFDVVLATWGYPDAFGAALVSKFLQKPLVVKVHGSDVNISSQYFLRRLMMKYAFNYANKVIAVSSTLKEKIIAMGINGDKIEVIGNGIDTDKFKPMDKRECREALGLPLDKKIILFVGNLVHVKGVDILIKAAKNLSDEFYVVLVGDGKMKQGLRSMVNAGNYQAGVSFAGRKSHDEIPRWMNAADVFCLPSLNEGCPNVILEALACRRPVVASRVGGIPDLIKSKEYGEMVSPCDSEELAQALLNVLEKKWDPVFLRDRVTDLSWKKNADRVFDVLY